MSDEIIQGDWDDLVARHDLHGRRVRVIVLDEQRPDTDNPWLKSLRLGRQPQTFGSGGAFD